MSWKNPSTRATTSTTTLSASSGRSFGSCATSGAATVARVGFGVVTVTVLEPVSPGATFDAWKDRHRSPDERFFVGYSPERIDPGNPRWDLVTTPKVVSGVGDASLDAVDAFFRTIVDQTVRVKSPGVAELNRNLTFALPTRAAAIYARSPTP